MGSVVRYQPLTKYLSVQLRPVSLVGNDHIVQDLLGDQQAGHGLGQGKGHQCLLVGVLHSGIHDQLLHSLLLLDQTLVEGGNLAHTHGFRAAVSAVCASLLRRTTPPLPP